MSGKDNAFPMGIGVLVAIAVAVGAGVIIPAGGLAVAIIDGRVIVPHLLTEASIVVAVTGGAVLVTRGAIPAVKTISKKRGSTFVALCSCFEWFAADSVSDLYLEGHSSIEKNAFKLCATVAFVLASGIWRQSKRWLWRGTAIFLFAVPTLLVTFKLLVVGHAEFTFHGAKLAVALGIPAVVAAFYIGLSATGTLKDE